MKIGLDFSNYATKSDLKGVVSIFRWKGSVSLLKIKC